MTAKATIWKPAWTPAVRPSPASTPDRAAWMSSSSVPLTGARAGKISYKLKGGMFIYKGLYKGSKLWNELPTDIKAIDTISAFKEKTKTMSKTL